MSIERHRHRGAAARRRRSPTPPADGPFSHSKRGARPDLGAIAFRSSWEANYARYLTTLLTLGVIAAWEYEPERFVFPGVRFGPWAYVPDFRVTAPDGAVAFHEVKGWMDAGSRAKLRRMQRFYPDVVLVVIGPKEYAAVAQWAMHIPGWE
jgi:hypothetical protein